MPNAAEPKTQPPQPPPAALPAPAGRPWPEGTPVVYAIRTSDRDRKSHGGFAWPADGLVEAPDFARTTECGAGLHGTAWGVGDWSLLRLADAAATWQVVEVPAAEVIDLGGKVKFPRCWLVHSGDMATALRLIAEKRIASLSGYDSPVSSSGRYSPVSSSGDCSPVSSSGNDSPVSSSGNHSPVSSSGNHSPVLASGKNCAVAACGRRGRARAGPGGAIAVAYHDAGGRPRFAVGHVGEGGIEAGVWYAADPATGKLVPWNG